MNLMVFGFGFTGHALARRKPPGWRLAGVSRDAGRRAAMVAAGVDPVDPADRAALATALERCNALLIAAPPDVQGCPALVALGPAVAAGRGPPWIGYLSTTGVYGDHSGRWVFEDTDLAPASLEAQRRVAAEDGWRAVAAKAGAALAVFRLPGIYGPGRCVLDRLQAGDARRTVKPGHVFSRIHVDDLAAGMLAALTPVTKPGVYNLCDDEPAASADVTTFGAQLLGLDPPPARPLDIDALSPMARRFWAESRRVSNASAKAALGWRPAYPTYREGLTAILAAERAKDR